MLKMAKLAWEYFFISPKTLKISKRILKIIKKFQLFLESAKNCKMGENFLIFKNSHSPINKSKSSSVIGTQLNPHFGYWFVA